MTSFTATKNHKPIKECTHKYRNTPSIAILVALNRLALTAIANASLLYKNNSEENKNQNETCR